GSTRSIPSMSVVGNRSPVSTTTIRPSYSTTIMFLPISPRPPSGRTRSLLLTRPPLGVQPRHGRRPRESSGRLGGLKQAVAFEHRAHHGGLLLVELDVRKPWRADLEADQVERGLRRAGQRRDGQVTVDVLEARVDLPAPLWLIDHPPHLLAEQVARDEDSSGLAEVEHVGEHLVVARVDLKAVD